MFRQRSVLQRARRHVFRALQRGAVTARHVRVGPPAPACGIAQVAAQRLRVGAEERSVTDGRARIRIKQQHEHYRHAQHNLVRIAIDL